MYISIYHVKKWTYSKWPKHCKYRILLLLVFVCSWFLQHVSFAFVSWAFLFFVLHRFCNYSLSQLQLFPVAFLLCLVCFSCVWPDCQVMPVHFSKYTLFALPPELAGNLLFEVFFVTPIAEEQSLYPWRLKTICSHTVPVGGCMTEAVCSGLLSTGFHLVWHHTFCMILWLIQ